MKKWLITVHSQKGGVGKTLLSFYLARRLGNHLKPKVKTKSIPSALNNSDFGMNLKTVLIDADLTGTSLAQVLRLKAPKLYEKGYYKVEQTNSFLKKLTEGPGDGSSQDPGNGPNFAFLNEALFLDPHENKRMLEPTVHNRSFHASKLLWKFDDKDIGSIKANKGLASLRIIPSSGLAKHVGYCLPHIYKEDITSYLGYRLLGLVWWLLYERHGKFDVVIIDTPPALWGMSRAVLKLHESLRVRHHEVRTGSSELANLALMISSADIQDILALAHGLDFLCSGERDSRIISPPRTKNNKDFKLSISDVRLVINRVPTNVIKGKNIGDATVHFINTCNEHLELQSKTLKNKIFFQDVLQDPISIGYDEDTSISFTSDRLTFDRIPGLETFYDKISEVMNNG